MIPRYSENWKTTWL